MAVYACACSTGLSRASATFQLSACGTNTRSSQKQHQSPELTRGPRKIYSNEKTKIEVLGAPTISIIPAARAQAPPRASSVAPVPPPSPFLDRPSRRPPQPEPPRRRPSPSLAASSPKPPRLVAGSRRRCRLVLNGGRQGSGGGLR